MRVPFMPEEEVIGLMEPLDAVQIQRFRDETPGGLIITAAHVGNNDVIGAAIAHMGLPLNVVADDSAFPGAVRVPARRNASSGTRRSSRGATCGRSSASCAAASCSACWSTGATAATGSR